MPLRRHQTRIKLASRAWFVPMSFRLPRHGGLKVRKGDGAVVGPKTCLFRIRRNGDDEVAVDGLVLDPPLWVERNQVECAEGDVFVEFQARGPVAGEPPADAVDQRRCKLHHEDVEQAAEVCLAVERWVAELGRDLAVSPEVEAHPAAYDRLVVRVFYSREGKVRRVSTEFRDQPVPQLQAGAKPVAPLDKIVRRRPAADECHDGQHGADPALNAAARRGEMIPDYTNIPSDGVREHFLPDAADASM